MTLLEVMIAMGLTTVMVGMAFSALGAGVTMARRGQQTVNSNEAARTGMDMLLRDLRLAGVPGGIWVSDASGPPLLISSIFTQAGTLGTDDLWLVVPRPNLMQANCVSPGSNAVVTAAGAGALRVNCTAPFSVTNLLLVSNFTSAALVSGLTFPSGTSINYAQQAVANFSNAPGKGGFQRGDLVFPVEVVRYSVRPNAVSGRPELVRHVGAINSTVSAAAPFIVPVGAAEQRFPDVEDLQVAFGTGVPPLLTFASAHNVLFTAASAPLALRISVVGLSPRIITDDNNRPLPLGPVTVEDHVPTPTLDGYRRSVYRRRVELLNMGMVKL